MREDWTQLELPLIYRILSPAQLAQRRAAGRQRAKAFTREYQQAANQRWQMHHLDQAAEWGKRGFAVTEQRYGREFAKVMVARKQHDLWAAWRYVERRQNAS
jgi:hypothetical protein